MTTPLTQPMKPGWPLTVQQTGAVFRRELRRSFFARRGLWVYLLAIAPLLVFSLFATVNHHQAAERRAWAAAQKHQITDADFSQILIGTTEATVIARLGPPAEQFTFNRRRRNARGRIEIREDKQFRYSDGTTLYTLFIENGAVRGVGRESGPTQGDISFLLATEFQFFFLRLGVFFGCLGIFMNLFRGELLDKSLHFYFLAPVRREVVMAGKFLAGLAASVVIFGISAAAQIWILSTVSATPLAHAPAYIGVTALACLGYGALFLAAGLLFRNPIVPAVALLLWESVVPFLPALLKKFSVFYYLTQMCPVSVASGPGTPPLISLLVSAPDPISGPLAVIGLIVLSALVLAYSARRVRRLEIDYSGD